MYINYVLLVVLVAIILIGTIESTQNNRYINKLKKKVELLECNEDKLVLADSKLIYLYQEIRELRDTRRRLNSEIEASYNEGFEEGLIIGLGEEA
jgi:hypothetical protein